MKLLDEEKAFDIAVQIFVANIQAGQFIPWRDLNEYVADILPNLYDAVHRSWLSSTMEEATH